MNNDSYSFAKVRVMLEWFKTFSYRKFGRYIYWIAHRFN